MICIRCNCMKESSYRSTSHRPVNYDDATDAADAEEMQLRARNLVIAVSLHSSAHTTKYSQLMFVSASEPQIN